MENFSQNKYYLSERFFFTFLLGSILEQRSFHSDVLTKPRDNMLQILN